MMTMFDLYICHCEEIMSLRDDMLKTMTFKTKHNDRYDKC